MEDHLNKYLASKLYALRRKANIKQSHLAEKLHISQQAYSKLEAGVTRFSDHTIETLCNYFQITPEEFLDEKTTTPARGSGSSFDHTGLAPDEKNPDLSLLIMEELTKMREERTMLIEFIKNQALEFQCERTAFLNQLKEFRRRKYRLF